MKANPNIGEKGASNIMKIRNKERKQSSGKEDLDLATHIGILDFLRY